MYYVVSVPPSDELLTSTEAKAHVTAIDVSDDTYIGDLIKDAREYCEGITGRALAAQTIEAFPEKFSYEMQLPMHPIVGILSVKYTDYDGAETTMSADNYKLDESCGKLAFKELPYFIPSIAKPIKITYTAGHTALPRVIRRAMLVLIAYWYDNRGDKELPKNVEDKVNLMLDSKKVFFL